MKLTTTLLATLIFASTGAIANTTKLTEQDELLVQRAQTINFYSCVQAQYDKMEENRDLLAKLRDIFQTMQGNILDLADSRGHTIGRDSQPEFSVDDAAIMIIASCIAPARN